MKVNTIENFIKYGKRLFDENVVDLNTSDDEPPLKLTPSDEKTKLVDNNNTYECYYVNSFSIIAQHIIDEKMFIKLLQEDDLVFIKKFLSELNVDSKRLILRLFGRKKSVVRYSQMKFADIKNIDFTIEILSNLGYIKNVIDSLSDLELLALLIGKEVQTIAKDFSYPCSSISQARVHLAKIISNHNSSTICLKKKMKRFISSCWSLSSQISKLISILIFLYRLFSEFNKSDQTYDYDSYLKRELYHSFLTRTQNSTSVIYPPYKIDRDSDIFKSIDEFNAVYEYVLFENRLRVLFDSKEFDQLNQIIDRDSELWLHLLHNEKYQRPDLPSFLSRYTISITSSRLLFIATQVLERKKLFESAGELIKKILFKKQGNEWITDSYVVENLGPKKVGRFVDRYICDIGYHTKNFDAVYEFIDYFSPDLRSGFKLGLEKYLERIKNSVKKLKLDSEIENMSLSSDTISYLEANTILIRALFKGTASDLGSRRPVYVFTDETVIKTENPDEPVKTNISTKLLTVEDLVAHYFVLRADTKYENALHCESSLYLLIFVVIFYDIIYNSIIPDVFYSMRQTKPLDLTTDLFYKNRRESIEKRLDLIRSDKIEDSELLTNHVMKIYSEHLNERCLNVNWDLFTDKTGFTMCKVIECMGGQVVAAFCEKLAKDYRNWCSGLPDLFVWNSSSKKCLIIEVKGPGDKLSDQQKAWIDVFVRAKAPVLLCNVEAKPEKFISISEDLKLIGDIPNFYSQT